MQEITLNKEDLYRITKMEKTVKKRKRRVVRKRSVLDSAARNAASLTDGCNPEFVIYIGSSGRVY